jgi:hypothetical protein
VSVSLAFSAGAQQIVGEHLVGPDGRINLGTYGSVHVAGKTIDEARAAIEAHLAKHLDKPEIVVDLFGNNSERNYSREAAMAILEIARQYDWRRVVGQNPTKLQVAILNAFFGGGETTHSISAQVWFPLVMEGVRAGDQPIQPLMHAILLNFGRLDDNADFAIDGLLELTQSESQELRLAAVRALVRLDRHLKIPRVVAWSEEMLNRGDPHEIIAWLQGLGPGYTDTVLPFDASHLLFHADENVQRYARNAIQHLRPTKDQGMVEFLLEVLSAPDRAHDHVPAVRALGALDREATSATSALERIAMDRHQPIPLRIAATIAVEEITNDDSLTNRLQADVLNENQKRHDSPEFRMEFKQFEQVIENERRVN